MVFVVQLTDERPLALFPAGTIVRDSQHRESPTRREQNFNLRRTRVQALLSEVVQYYYSYLLLFIRPYLAVKTSNF